MGTKFNKSGLTLEENQQSVSYKWQNQEARVRVLQSKAEGTISKLTEAPRWDKLSTNKKIEALLKAGVKPERKMRMGSTVSIVFPGSAGIVLNTEKEIAKYEEIRKKVLGIIS